MLERILKLDDIKEDSIFLWGARQTGKSTLLKTMFPDAIYIDLLRNDVFERYRRQPSLLREQYQSLAQGSIIIIDEVQKLPELLDEVHWLIANKDLRFILSGSSARKLKRCGANLLGGRALRSQLLPLVSAEIPDFDIIKAANYGTLPRHYLTENPRRRLQSYIGDYLQEEIKQEALSRNMSVFTRFLEIAAICDGEILNFKNIATDCGVSGPTIKEYFSILEETLIGFYQPAFTKVLQRRAVQSPRFFFFDIGIANYLTRKNNLQPGSVDFGHAFEHLIIQEVRALIEYHQKDNALTYWRTSTGVEVDIIITDIFSGDAVVAIEIKSATEIQPRHLKGLRTFRDEYPDCKLIAVSLDEQRRVTSDNIQIIPAKEFLSDLWTDKIF